MFRTIITDELPSHGRMIIVFVTRKFHRVATGIPKGNRRNVVDGITKGIFESLMKLNEMCSLRHPCTYLEPVLLTKFKISIKL